MGSGNNIQALREQRGWSRPELGKRMGTSGQQVERLEKAQRRLTQDWIDKAAAALGVDPTDIIRRDLALAARVEPDLPPVRMAEDDTVEITALDLSFSMGPGTEIDDYIEETAIRFDLNYLRTLTRAPPQRLRIARGVGDSMFPTLQSSDRLLIDTTQRILNLNDRIWAISLFGAAAIKRLRTIGPDRVLVISDNPAVPDQEVSVEDLRIGGRVVSLVGRDL